MGIPILDEIWAGIRWLVNLFVYQSPKPVKILVFLLFLLLLSPVISVFLQLIGIHCDTDKNVMKLPALDLTGNVGLLFTPKEQLFNKEILNFSEVHPKLKPSDCYFFARKEGFKDYEQCNQSNTTGCEYYYDEGECYNCTVEKDIIFEEGFLPIRPFTAKYTICKSNVYHTGGGFSENIADFFTCDLDCIVPKDYIFNKTDGKYHCINPAVCGNNSEVVNTAIDSRLESHGAELLYPSGTKDESYTGVVRMECNNNLKPRMTFFGIDVFNYQIWVAILLLTVMIIVLLKIREIK